MAERPVSQISGPILPAPNTPLPGDAPSLPFGGPRASFLDTEPTTPRLDSPAQLNANDSSVLLENKPEHPAGDQEGVVQAPAKSKNRRGLILFASAATFIIVVLVVILPVYFTVIKPKRHSSAHANDAGGLNGPQQTGTSFSSPAQPSATTTAPSTSGGDGSTVRASDGTTFTYQNAFGGIWVADPDDPYNNNAYPNSWTPPLNQSWDYAKNRINGVNLGGWFVLEPFISPELFQRYPGARDEWSLSLAMAADPANGGLGQIEDHYKTFITEQDIANIAGAGLNWVRLPIPYWAVDVYEGEPFLAKTSWKYILQALQWCRKYGLRVNLDLHTIPGSQNAFNHSGKLGQVNFLLGVMGVANAQRAMNYIRIITEFISQPEWQNVVTMFGIMNEPLVSQIGQTALRGFYVEAYKMIRNITGVGEGKGPFMSIHDGFQGFDAWTDFLNPGADRLALDQHPYFAFSGGPATAPIDTGTGSNAGGTWPQAACDRWASVYNSTRNTYGVVVAGEWSNGFNDCGLFLRGVGGQASYGGNCDIWQDSSHWSAGTKAGLLRFSSASMDALRDWFFWTWKIGNSTAGHVESPLWSYKLGLEGGWIPRDPRTAIGVCGPPDGPIFDDSFDAWVTGGAGAGNLRPAQTEPYPFPPTALADAPAPVSLLPVYTPTGAISTLPPPTFTDTKGNAIVSGNGWFNPQDNIPAPTPIADCTYPDPWDAVMVPVPPLCTGAPDNLAAQITPPPQ
ncbi:hypothetical protein CVT24_007452 [Panaeolus cyanescens]|uniref:glucan 1,3-beta-glucosidase n=1 Tax=Panaeolus cyanescens TaxID=181874 RepID=A0A409W4Y1_9AGAR|nr:hypothetical protein CVT24_007452 [Panaeolus cyanescens]